LENFFSSKLIGHEYKFEINQIFEFSKSFSLLLANPILRSQNPKNHIGKLEMKKKKISLF